MSLKKAILSELKKILNEVTPTGVPEAEDYIQMTPGQKPVLGDDFGNAKRQAEIAFRLIYPKGYIKATGPTRTWPEGPTKEQAVSVGLIFNDVYRKSPRYICEFIRVFRQGLPAEEKNNPHLDNFTYAYVVNPDKQNYGLVHEMTALGKRLVDRCATAGKDVTPPTPVPPTPVPPTPVPPTPVPPKPEPYDCKNVIQCGPNEFPVRNEKTGQCECSDEVSDEKEGAVSCRPPFIGKNGGVEKGGKVSQVQDQLVTTGVLIKGEFTQGKVDYATSKAIVDIQKQLNILAKTKMSGLGGTYKGQILNPDGCYGPKTSCAVSLFYPGTKEVYGRSAEKCMSKLGIKGKLKARKKEVAPGGSSGKVEESKNWLDKTREETTSNLFERLVKDATSKKVI